MNFKRSKHLLIVQALPIYLINVFLFFPAVLQSRSHLAVILAIDFLMLILLIAKFTTLNMIVLSENLLIINGIFGRRRVLIDEVTKIVYKRTGFSYIELKGGGKIMLPLFEMKEQSIKKLKECLADIIFEEKKTGGWFFENG